MNTGWHSRTSLFTSVVLHAAVLITLASYGCGDGNTDRSPASTTPPPAGGEPVPSPSPSPNGGGTSASVVRPGVWGGSNSALTVRTSNASFRYNCSTGNVPGRILLNRDGEFDTTGTIREPGDTITRSARYEGRVNGNQLQLTVSFTNSAGNTVQYIDTLTFGFEGPLPPICAETE
jgi:hypothetical protein